MTLETDKTNGLRILSMEIETPNVKITISKVWSLENPALPPAATVDLRDKNKAAWASEHIDLENFEALKDLKDALDKFMSYQINKPSS